jgi:hypothetical protein
MEREYMGMNKELQKYYENRFDLFIHPGWKDLMEDVQAMLKASNTLSGATPENLGFKQGEIAIMQWILSLQETTESTYKDLSNENS